MVYNSIKNAGFVFIILSILTTSSCSGQKVVASKVTHDNALVIIDCQEGFFSNPDNPVYNEDLLVKNINELIEHYRESRQPIIFVRHIDKDLIKGSDPWQVYSRIQSKPDDLYVEKTTPDSFLNTTLMSVLNEKKIDTMVISGLQTDYCIDTTCRSAFGKHIPVILASDAHSTYDNSFMDAEQLIKYHNSLIGSWFAELKTTEEIINK